MWKHKQCVCFDNSFQRSLSWASSCNNTTASRLLLSCHTAAIATTCQSHACVQNDDWIMCVAFLNQILVMHLLHCKKTCCLLLCGSCHSCKQLLEKMKVSSTLWVVCKVFGVTETGFDAIGLTSFILLHLRFYDAKLLDLSLLLLSVSCKLVICIVQLAIMVSMYLFWQTVMGFGKKNV